MLGAAVFRAARIPRYSEPQSLLDMVRWCCGLVSGRGADPAPWRLGTRAGVGAGIGDVSGCGDVFQEAGAALVFRFVMRGIPPFAAQRMGHPAPGKHKY